MSRSPAKKVAAKRVPAKKTRKAAPVAAKKVYRRKPKPEAETAAADPVVSVAVNTEAAGVTDQTNNFPTENEISSFAKAMHAAERFSETEFIDLRKLPAMARFLIVYHLQTLGFIFADATDKVTSEMFDLFLYADTIKLQHNNKLLTCVCWDEAKSSSRICRVLDAGADVSIVFSDPVPSVLVVGDDLFVRDVN